MTQALAMLFYSLFILWCTFQRRPPRRHKCLLFLKFFILWLSTAAYLVYLLPWAPEMTQVLTVLKVFILWLSTAAYLMYFPPCALEMAQVLTLLKVFYSIVRQNSIPGVPPTVGPTDDACFLFLKFFILWSGTAANLVYRPTRGPLG